MTYITVKLASNASLTFVDKESKSGKEKKVFFSKDKKRVICFFMEGLKDPTGRKARIVDLIENYNPSSGTDGDYWSEHFCWPLDIFDDESQLPKGFIEKHGLNRPVLAVVAPVYTDNFYMTIKGKKEEKKITWFTSGKVRSLGLVPDNEQGNTLLLLHVCTWLARSIRKLHSYGIAHTDLSPRNVLVDPRGGSAVTIDLDSVAISGKYDPIMAGSFGYQAPEIVSSNTIPTIQTDLHSLAVLIYEILFKRHPVRGKRTFGKEAEEDDKLIFGSQALFVEHPTNKVNPAENMDFGSCKSLGPHLEQCFYDAFVTGLHSPAQRPTGHDWEIALYRTLDLLHPTLDNKDWYIIGSSSNLVCPRTQQRPPWKVPIGQIYQKRRKSNFIKTNRKIVVRKDMRIEPWHIFRDVLPTEGSNRDCHGTFSYSNGKWWLANYSDHIMQNGLGVEIGKNAVIEICDGTEVQMSPDDKGLKIRFELL